MPAERASKAIAFRGALWITLIALVSTALALTLQYVQTTRMLDRQSQALLDDEAASLVERYRAGGIVELAAFMRRQQELPRLNQFFYLLTDLDGEVLAGNLSAWPAEVEQAGFHTFRATVVSADGEARRRWVQVRALLPDLRYALLVGQFAEERAALRDRYLAALFWSLLVTGLVGLALGWALSRRALAFVDRVSRTGERFLAGHYEERVPLSGRGDEYDRLAATINACFREIEHVLRSLRAATDGMAHDLKTPLTRIGARLQLAELGPQEAGALRLAIEESRAELDGLLRLIDGMLRLARTEATTAAAFEQVDLAEIVRDAVDLYAPVAEDKGLVLAADLGPAPLQGAPALLGQLAVNLLDNAIKYAPARSRIEVAVVAEGRAVRLSVADQGPGIPAERREDVLSRFVRLDESRGQPGAGLGLSIASAVARIHRAELRLEDNAPGLRVIVRFAADAAIS